MLAQHAFPEAFGINTLMGNAAVHGLSEEHWLEGFGDLNPVIWIMSHILCNRRIMCRNLGQTIAREDWEDAVAFDCPKVTIDVFPYPAEIMEEFNDLGQALAGLLADVSGEVLAEIYYPDFPDGTPRSNQMALSFQVHHEMIHIGQVSLLRRIFQQDGIAPIAMEMIAAMSAK